jgi:hypothetical protein
MVGDFHRFCRPGGDVSFESHLPVEPDTQPAQCWLVAAPTQWHRADCKVLIDYAWRVALSTLSGKMYHFQLFWRKGYLVCGSPLIDLPDVFSKPFSVFVK